MPVTEPIYQTASFLLPDLEAAAHAYGPDGLGDAFTYSRYGNPTCAALEARVAAMEGGRAAVATASGMAAVALAVLTIAEAGDNIVCSAEVYGGTRAFFAHTLRRMGVEARFVDSAEPEAFVRASDDRTRAWYGETLPNPSLRVFPVADVAGLGRALGIPLIVDNTAAPLLARPIEHGAAVVVHSATKWIGGHGSVLGGVVVDGAFPWSAHPQRCPALVTPDASYHGVVWTELVERGDRAAAGTAYAVRLRRTVLRDLGPALAPASAGLLLQGMQTLAVRLDRQCTTAARIAAWLAEHPQVLHVNHPGRHRGRDAARRDALLRGGHGSLIGVELRHGYAGARRFIEALRLVRHVVNIGDVRTLVTHPASTTHAQLDDEARRAAGVVAGYIRLSIGLEHPDDLLADLAAALDAVATDQPLA